jgi:PST family polysaccharide transporter
MATALGLYVSREWLVRTLLSAEFLPLVDVLGIQLLGDVLKVGSWVMAFTMVSHAQTRAFIVTEGLFAALLVISSVVLAREFGLRGAAGAYVLTYAVYWATMFWLFGGLTARLAREETAPQPTSFGQVAGTPPKRS